MAFYQFPKLPLELRQQIWEDACEPAQTFYHYKKGCWKFQQITEGNSSYIRLTFQNELLNPVQLSPALLFVNYEARDTAIKWLKKRGRSTPPVLSQDRLSAVSISQYNPSYDALYFDFDLTCCLCHNPFYELTRYPWDCRYIGPQCTRLSPVCVKYLALPAIHIRLDTSDTLVCMLDICYPYLEELWIVVGTRPGNHFMPHLEQKVNERWEIDPTVSEIDCQQAYNETGNNGEEGAIPKPTLKELIQNLKKTISDYGSPRSMLDFVVRPVVAVRR